ncbi:type III secretion system (T3SS) inner membrane Yop/YscD-like protein [Saccharothrix variisporea]|uniref:Type III secretion system (T3SS) inner membrane Yop/YscD-like protein n=1 Tax=Saccharothrix variisporea TaxID=543527 RepID=A0A495XLD2_9PSEU|nr:type III secretion system (T3SS) inner membrane Yop/YscD-like protein [Saccharothrix variisporea]
MEVTAAPSHRVADLAAALGCRQELYLGATPLPGWLSLTDAGIADGAVLGLDRSAPPVMSSAVGGGVREIAVVGGLHGGPSATLYPSGALTIGRGTAADLVLRDSEVSRRHARVVTTGDGVSARLEDTGSRNGVRRNGELISGPVDLGPRDVVGLGETVVGLRPVVPADARVDDLPGTPVRVFHRPSRAPAAARAEDFPDPTRVAALACAPSSRLWERRPSDVDFLRLRVGLRDEPAVAVEAVDLRQCGVFGIAGPRPSLTAVARALVAQAAVLHAPDDLAVVVVTGHDAEADWDWVGWLPHTRPPTDDFDCARLVATDAGQARARLGELYALVRERVARRHGALRAPGPDFLLVLDGVRRLRELPGLGELLSDGPPVGVHLLCLAQPGEVLPEGCAATLVATGPTGTRGRLTRPAAQAVHDVLLDGLAPDHATRLALALAPFRLEGEQPHEDWTGPIAVRERRFTALGRAQRAPVALDDDPDRTTAVSERGPGRR